MKIFFTGTQSGMTKYQKEELGSLLVLLKCSEFSHGDCIGADKEANEIAFDSGIKVFTIFPPVKPLKRAWCFNEEKVLNNNNLQWNTLTYKGQEIKVRWMPRDEYINRNRHGVDNCAWVVAAPKEHTISIRSGTWATIRYAWKVRKDKITIIPPIVREDE